MERRLGAQKAVRRATAPRRGCTPGVVNMQVAYSRAALSCSTDALLSFCCTSCLCVAHMSALCCIRAHARVQYAYVKLGCEGILCLSLFLALQQETLIKLQHTSHRSPQIQQQQQQQSLGFLLTCRRDTATAHSLTRCSPFALLSGGPLRSAR